MMTAATKMKVFKVIQTAPNFWVHNSSNPKEYNNYIVNIVP